MQLSIDGYVAGPNGEMDWMTWGWGDDIKEYVTVLTEPVDTILMGRKLAEGFIPHWEGAMAKPETADPFAQKMEETHKVVFSRSMSGHTWKNTDLVTGDLAEEVKKLKAKDGGDMITYGGGAFASSLIQARLVDEYNLFINPTAIGNGMTIFKQLEERLPLKLVKTQAFESGIVTLYYVNL